MISGLLTPSHLIILLIIGLLVLGPKRLPDTARALGASFREFKDGIASTEDEREPVARAEVHERTDARG